MTTTPSPPQPKIPNEPALFITAQTTVPLLTTLMFTFSLAAIGFAVSQGWPSVNLPFLSLTTKDVALVLLGVATLLFLSATEACVKSHAWDYFAISVERQQFENLSVDPFYKQRCSRRNRFWYTLAAQAYNAGVVFILLGVALLFWPVTAATSILIGVVVFVALVGGLIDHYNPRLAEDATEALEQRMKIF